MKRSINIRTCIGDQFDPADVKLRSFRIIFPGTFAASLIADDRAIQLICHWAAGFTVATVRMPLSSFPVIVTCCPGKFFKVS